MCKKLCNIYRPSVFLLLIVLCSILPRSLGNIMGEHCDWSGNGLSLRNGQSRGVTPVYLRCTQGTVRWTFPRGALRVLLRLPSNKDFRGCIRASEGFSGARIFLEGQRSLTPLFSVDDGAHNQMIRCFQSKGGQAALYFEAVDPTPDMTRRQAEFSYDLQPIPKGLSLIDLLKDECRPCTKHELAHAFCTSDLVTRGSIHSVDDLNEIEIARVNVRLKRTLRHALAEEPDNEEMVGYVMPRHCEPQTGPGEFIFMGRQRLGDLALTCAVSLQQWAIISNTMNQDGSAHCILKS